MSSTTEELPACEFERRRAERRGSAVRTLARYTNWWLAAQGTAAALGVGVAVAIGFAPRISDASDAVQWTAVALFALLLFVGVMTFECAVVVAVVALRNFTDLPRRWIAAAAGIWLLVVTELLAVVSLS